MDSTGAPASEAPAICGEMDISDALESIPHLLQVIDVTMIDLVDIPSMSEGH